jgi:hypothetical protein
MMRRMGLGIRIIWVLLMWHNSCFCFCLFIVFAFVWSSLVLVYEHLWCLGGVLIGKKWMWVMHGEGTELIWTILD